MTIQLSHTHCQVALTNTHASNRQIVCIDVAFKLYPIIVKGSIIMLSTKSCEIEKHYHLPICQIINFAHKH